jgi:hypothetical protein
MRTKMANRRGGSSIMAVFFVTLFSVLALSFTSMSTVNVSMARNHRDLTGAQAATESGLAYARFLVNSYIPPTAAYTTQNTVSLTEAQSTFGYFAAHVQTTLASSPILGGHGMTYNNGDFTLKVPASGTISVNSTGDPAGFWLFFEFIPGTETLPHRIIVTSHGSIGQTSRGAQLVFPIKKNNDILKFACASRGRMWLTGNTTVHGPIFSYWSRTDISPLNITSDVVVEGSLNTVLSHDQIFPHDVNGNPLPAPYQFESYDEDGNPVENSGDEINGQYEGINYWEELNAQKFFDYDMPGMDINDYNTTAYKTGLTTIPSTSTTTVEYFPHAAASAGGYAKPRDGTPTNTPNRRLTRQVYQNQNYNNAMLPSNRNALFRNCTFNGVLYVDSGTATSTTNYNNVRFENCTFNGAIISNAPQSFKWMHNALYFTGSATFNNQSAVQEATILAPHFNVNLGNTNPNDADTNVLTGAIIGGIVDVRGNADVYGTILSMCDTSAWSSGYVSNIGATLADGGSETIEVGDVGTINITPNPDQLLPSGIRTPIVIKCQGDTYTEL